MIALAGTITMLAGCVEENLDEIIKVKDGDEIVFGARAGYENNSPDTKTIYKGTTYVVGNKTLEAVHWLPGDKVMIYCDQGNQTAHYQVTATGTGNNTEAETSLEKMQLHGVGNNGIQWQNIKENDHTFYAVYPSPYQFSTPNVDSGLLEASNYQDRITGEGTQLNCYLPVSQAPSSIEVKADGSGYIAHPNMDYAYMIAKQVVKANANGEVPAGVDLDFRPIVTALEVTMTFPENYTYEEDGTGNDIEVTYSPLTISNVRLETTDGDPLVGPFSLDLANYEFDDSEVTYPSVTIPQSNEVRNTVGVQLYRDVDGLPTPLTLQTGQKLTFTVFMLPTDINNLKIYVDLKSGSLKNLTIEAHKKQFLVNLVLPATSSETTTTTTSGSNWISQLPEHVLIEGLSIPGTANSFSYNYGRAAEDLANDASSTNNNYMTQTLSFENQWNLGVRCFEIVCDRNSSANTTATLAAQPVMCHGQSVGLNVTDAFDMVLDKLTADGNEKEFAMIIITYQPVGGSGNPDRSPSIFMTQLKNFYNNYRYNNQSLAVYTCLYEPGLDLEAVRKTPLMIVARPTQEGEDSVEDVNNAVAGQEYNILTVKGWGTLVDKWYKRGYDAMLFKGKKSDGLLPHTNYGNALDNLHPTLPAMEDYIYGFSGEYDGQYEGRPTRVNGNQRFEYLSDQNYDVWAQEWRRVSESRQTLTFTNIIAGYDTYWDESFSLKQEDIIDCLVRSISNEGNRVYFNSLDGFYVTNNRNSCDYYWRGNMGNIGDYAEDINSWFYPEILKYSATNVTGPLGVVILDRVDHTGAGSLIPEVIYMNNWRHTLDTSTDRISGSAWVDSWDTEIL